MRWVVVTSLIAVILVSACGSRSPQEESRPAPAASSRSAGPATDTTLGYGRHHHPIQTTNPEAQRVFDLGMAQAFGFNHEAAIRSFERASELDPAAPMP